jgi:uncharacterized small protein (DUF1192 family)
MAAIDDDALNLKRAKLPVHELGQVLDDLSAPELAERIGALKDEIERLERAIAAREATKNAAAAFFKR